VTLHRDNPTRSYRLRLPAVRRGQMRGQNTCLVAREGSEIKLTIRTHKRDVLNENKKLILRHYTYVIYRVLSIPALDCHVHIA
jgi:hypothetical protein